MPVKAKELRYAVVLEGGGAFREEDDVPLVVPAEWTAEHLLLAALVRCTLTSLRYHARRATLQVSAASGSARALVTRRESDGRYAVVEAEAEFAVEITPKPDGDQLTVLLGKAEHDCFVGASLRAMPSYRWTVNGDEAATLPV